MTHRRFAPRPAVFLGLFAVLGVAAASAIAAPPKADSRSEAKKVFEDLYAQRIQQARATRQSDDDLTVAAELIAGAREAAASPELARMMLQTAFDLSHTVRDGYATAEKALDQLTRRFPDQADQYAQQRMDLYERWFSATRGPQQDMVGRKLVKSMIDLARNHLAEDQLPEAERLLSRADVYARRADYSEPQTIDKLLDRVRSRKRTMTRIRSYESRLQSNPNDAAAAAELFRLYLVELNDPNQARPYVEHSSIEDANDLLPLVGKPIDEVPTNKLVEIGDWYRLLSKGASDRARPDLLERAKKYYTAYLRQPAEAEDMSRSHAALALRQIDQALGLTAQPQPVNKSMSDWISFAARRERRPPADQIEMIKQALNEVNAMHVRVRFEHNKDRITSVDLRNNEDITNIMPLYGLQLDRLNLYRCKRIESIEVLRGMPLKWLNLSGCQNLRSIAVLKDMPLTYVNLDNCWNLRGDLSVLKGKKLTKLNLHGCDGLDSLHGIEGMPLKSLNLHGCRNITGNLEECKGMQLTFLDISRCNKLNSVEGVNAASVQHLVAEDSPIVDDQLKGIAHFRPKQLNISYNRNITTLKPLVRMPLVSLEARRLNRNLKHEDFMVLKQIPTLKQLNINSGKWRKEILGK